MSREQHWDVASYALGVLDPADSERFEEHLATCWVCAGELESFLPAVDALSEVDGDDLAVTEEVTDDGVLLGRVLTAVGDDRRRARQQRLIGIAAGVILIALFSGVALFAGARWAGQPDVVAGPTAPATTAPASIGPGEEHSATDATSGVHAELAAESRPFGTRISFALTRLEGPATCRLVVLTDDGGREVVSSWRVPEQGYGTPSRPDPLVLQTATAASLENIRAVQVEKMGPDGAASPLVTIQI
ncbi:zf-HC2 domain-containing protein [Asanoa siamensis]|uniref:Membrane protein n=1 Tax=Asanoa siamensis TaxID=926357 RepID=A0ABQ4CW88_9ACTN|nr:zf-HC2 domain-containing protein [Asanoa siamensis]GIF75097.1 membrane protein [Asanoa siamensis]